MPQFLDAATKAFGPAAGLAIALLCVVSWTLWREYQKQVKAAPGLLERVITALNSATNTIDKNTVAKEENTRVGNEQINAFERQEEECKRLSALTERLRDSIERLHP